MDTSLRIAGAAGQGVETVGELLTDTFAGLGLHAFTTQTYMSRIRGGVNWFDIRIADVELFSGREKVDLLVALRPEAVEMLASEVAPGGQVLFSGGAPAGENAIAIDFEGVAKEVAKSAVMANSVAAGAVMEMLGYDLAPLFVRLEAVFLERKGPQVVADNITCAQRGAELARPHAGRLRGPAPAGAPSFTISGNEAIALGIATAGTKFVAAYPMTPSTNIFTALAGMQERYGMLVEQAEDEIAAINMVTAATYAGVPAATMTSGGGFALMVEGIALAGMLELPAFIVLGQRPGPATGLPTRTAQQDLRFALHAGHGEFAKEILAPGTPQQAYELARRGLELAHKYQTPVIMMNDQYLADIRKNMAPLDDTLRPIDRHILEDPTEDYVRYAITDSGVSPRALPGGPALVVVDSDEHREDGHITEDLGMRVQMQDKRMRKLAGMAAEALAPEWYGPEGATEVLICWGSTYGPCREGVDRLKGAGRKVGMLHFAQVWPPNVAAARARLAGATRIACAECNQGGQFAGLLREVGILDDCERITKYNGLPFTGEEIARRFGS